MRRGFLCLCVAALAVMSGCATTREAREHHDPLEPFNRAMLTTNLKLNDYVMRPVTHAYHAVIPRIARTGVHNVVANLAYPNVFLNDFLQGRFRLGLQDTLRFVTNSILGIAGLFDVATPLGLHAHEQSFGVTMGVWGVGEGPFVVLPFFGPYNARGLLDLPLSIFDNPGYYWNAPNAQTGLVVSTTVDRADSQQTDIDEVENSIEPYSFVRNAFRQHEAYLVRSARGESEQPTSMGPLEELEKLSPTPPTTAPPATPSAAPADRGH